MRGRISSYVQILAVLTCLALVLPAAAAEIDVSFDGEAEYQTDELGWYAFISGGADPARLGHSNQGRNGNNASGGVFRYITDDPDWGYPIQQWNKDDWFDTNTSIGLSMFDDGGGLLYDNTGIPDGTFGDYYDESGSFGLAGLYCGQEMSNNYDWIYSGYFHLDHSETVSSIRGYFAETYYSPWTFNPYVEYRMNIWGEDSSTLLPSTDSMVGDVWSSDNWAGSFAWADTGVDRIYSGFSNGDDNIYALTFALDDPITLEAGDYYFSHDAYITEQAYASPNASDDSPEPATWLLLGATGIVGLIRRRRS
jgi:hypothetical protein